MTYNEMSMNFGPKSFLFVCWGGGESFEFDSDVFILIANLKH